MFKSLAFSLGVVFLLSTTVSAQQDDTPENNDPKQETAQEVKSDKLKVGDEAPDWELVGSNGETYKLSNFKGKQGVVVAWYPMALTGG